MLAIKCGAKVVEKFVLPWWWKPIRKVLPFEEKRIEMASIEPDGGGDRTVRNNSLLVKYSNGIKNCVGSKGLNCVK